MHWSKTPALVHWSKVPAQARSKAGRSQVPGPRVGCAEATVQARAKAVPRASGTFAGRRCPTDANKRAEFDELKAHYLQARLEAVKAAEEVSGSRSSPKTRKRRYSENQVKYWATMKKRMQELAREGVPGADRMRIAAAEWKLANAIA